MQWDGGANAGFTSGTPWITPPDNYREINAENERRDDDSILNYYKRLIQLRKEEPVVAEGQIAFLFQDVPGVFAYRRFLEGRELFVVCNLTRRDAVLDGAPWSGGEKLLGNYGDSSPVLRPYEAAVYRR